MRLSNNKVGKALIQGIPIILFVILLIHFTLVTATNETFSNNSAFNNSLFNETFSDLNIKLDNVTIPSIVILELNITPELNNTSELNTSQELNATPDNQTSTEITNPEPIKSITTDNSTNLDIKIKNSKNIKLDSDIKVFENGKLIEKLNTKSKSINSAKKEIYKLEIKPKKGPISRVVLNNVNIKSTVELNIEDTPEDIKVNKKTPEEIYSIDPSSIEFTNGTLTSTAKGNRLYKCKDWDFQNQVCTGSWTYLKSITPGQEYNITLTPADPGFAEIIATDAIHLDENYNEISNIYNDIQSKDNIWSEPIYQNEIVRVTFEENLTNGRLIDVYVRSNQTMAYFDIYEAGTDNKVGRSGTTEYPELQYMEVNGLSQPTDTFDFKVIKVLPNPLDNSTNIDPAVNSFLEFDFIHDDVINTSQADSIIVYQELNIQTPRYRSRSETNTFSAELTDALAVGGDITWVVTKENHHN